MAGTGRVLQRLVVLRLHIGVTEQDGDGRACGMAVVDAAEKLRHIVFRTWRCAFGPALSASEVGSEVGLRERDAWRTAVNGDTNARPVRFAKDMYPENGPEAVHRLKDATSWKKAGYDLFTASAPVMMTSPSATWPKMAAIMAMR